MTDWPFWAPVGKSYCSVLVVSLILAIGSVRPARVSVGRASKVTAVPALASSRLPPALAEKRRPGPCRIPALVVLGCRRFVVLDHGHSPTDLPLLVSGL